MMGMRFVLAYTMALAVYALPCLAQDSGGASAARVVEIVRSEKEYSHARLEPARVDGRLGLAVIFEGTEDLHYYARAETAPAPELQLKVEATAPGVEFGKAVFPAWRIITDPTGKKAEVYVGKFRVFLPLRTAAAAAQARINTTVRIRGIACTSQLCLPPFNKTLTATVDLSKAAAWSQIATPPVARQTTLPYGTIAYYLLAIVAGVSINLMPCVLPVLPLVLMRLVSESKRAGGRRVVAGLAFSAGVIGFFAVFALVSAIINLTTGAVLDLNALFRYPTAVIVLFLAIVLFGLVMLDVVTLSLPSALTSHRSTTSGIAGTVGMGFFAGILSTPCSGALLGFVLVWAQTQPLLVSSIAIVLMGIGMALPYAVLVLVPSLIDRLPKPGYWMEIFKKSTAFLLFFIAVKLTLAALPKDKLLNVLTYGIVFSFCAWMWGKWVDLSTPAPKKWTIRATAAVIALISGLWLLPLSGRSAQGAIDWQPYDARLVQQAVAQHRPVLLDFMADWCTNCKVVDRRVYQDPGIAKLIREKGVLPVKADTTIIDYPATKDLRQIYGEAGNVPVTVALLPDGSQEKWRGIFDKEQLAQLLKKLPEAKTHGREENVSQDSQGGQAESPKGGDLR
ncbi:MAG: thioredoxin family protein [Planctomycetes bacterium]|nr:thioredoxin family protein [Planctomycetota bacterium]